MPRSGWLAVGAVAGALTAELAGLRLLAGGLSLAAAVLLGVGAIVASPVRRRIAVPAACALAGALAIALRLAVLPAPAAPTAALPDGSGPWAASVVSVGSPREGHQTGTLRISGPEAGALLVAATLPRYPVVTPGSRVEVEGRLLPPPDSPYGAYLERIGAVGTLRASVLRLVPGPVEPPHVLEDVRRAAAAALARVLPEPEAGLAAGILIGLRDRVDRELAADFTTAGVSHVVAISGWNIAIVAAAVAAVAGSLDRRRRSVLTIAAIVVYVAFSGASPSVVRAGAMAGVVLLARESGRAGRAAAALGWAVVLLLAADPALIADAGFQLSSLATAGLIAWATPLGTRIGALGGGRVPGWLAESLGVSLAAQAATLPVVLATFGRLALISPVANLFIVPVVPIAMATGALALGAGLLVAAGAPMALGAALAFPGWIALALMVGIGSASADVPFASAELAPPANLAAAAGATFAIGWLEWRRRRPKRVARGAPAPGKRTLPAIRLPRPRHRATRTAVLLLAASLVVAGAAATQRPAGVASVTILDVGQGDAILVEGSRGGRLLVDGGPDPDRLLIELDRRLPPWDRRIDAVVLTHPHEDHVAGLPLLLERFAVGRTFEPGMRGPGPGYEAWDRTLGSRGTTHALLAAGDRLTVDEVVLDVLWPRPGEVPPEPPDTGTGINNVSIVLLGSIEGRRFLLTGDIEEEVDPELREQLARVDLLKVAHHGSRTASTDAFLASVDPTVAVTSAGAGNRYGHPAPETIERLEATGAHVFRTDRDGAVTVAFERGGLRVSTTGGRPRPTPRPTTSGARDPAPSAFACAIPAGIRAAATGVTGGPEPARPTSLRLRDGLLYHRADDGSGAGRGRPAAVLARSSGLAAAALARRRGGRRLARGANAGGGRQLDRSRGRRGRGAAPRRRQGAAAGRSPPSSATRRRFRRVAGRARPPGARGGRRGPSRDPPRGRCLVRPVAGERPARGAPRRLRRQAGRSAARVDGRPLRVLAAALSPGSARHTDGGLGRRHAPGRAGPRCAAGAAGLRARRCGTGRGPPSAVDGGSDPRGRCDVDRTAPVTASRARDGAGAPPVVALFWGDDDLSAARAVDRLAGAHAAATGLGLERWDVRGEVAGAADIVARIIERISTPVLFGGGTLAVVTNAGPLLRAAEHRDPLLAAVAEPAPGNAVIFVEQTASGAKAPPQKRLADAIAAAGGVVREFRSPRGGSLVGWIESEARDRGLRLEGGAAKELAERIGGLVQEGDVERRHQTRIAAAELDKLALYRPGRPIGVEDVRALVPEAVPGSIWAFTDAVGERRSEQAVALLERLIASTPEPVLVTVLHRRIRELLEVADRVAAGEKLPAIGRAMKIASEFRMRNLAAQARAWSVADLRDALDGLVELDAMVKGAPGANLDAAQRRLAFDLWILDRVARG